MKQLIKFIVTVVLTVCLPLQGAAAVVMPLCSTPKGSQATVMLMHSSNINDQNALTCDQASHLYCASPTGQKSGENSDVNCFACHLSVAQLPSVFAVAIQPEIATKFLPLTTDHYQTFLSGLFRPPKPIFA